MLGSDLLLSLALFVSLLITPTVQEHQNFTCGERCLESLREARLQEIQETILRHMHLSSPVDVEDVDLNSPMIEAAKQKFEEDIRKGEERTSSVFIQARGVSGERTNLVARFPLNGNQLNMDINSVRLNVQLFSSFKAYIEAQEVEVRVFEKDVEGEIVREIGRASAILAGRSQRVWVPLESGSFLKRPNEIMGLYVEALVDGVNVAVHPQMVATADENMFIEVEFGQGVTRKRRSFEKTCLQKGEKGCCLHELMVDFRKLNWNFVLSPIKYNAFMCKGDCSLNRHVLPRSGHSRLIHHQLTFDKNQKVIAQPSCCYPSEYEEVKMMYINSDHQITEARVPGMIARKDISSLVTHPRAWNFCDSGQYAVCVESLKHARWHTENLATQLWNKIYRLSFIIYVYDTTDRTTYRYRKYSTNFKVWGYYWHGNNLVIVGLNAVSGKIEMQFLEMNHSQRHASIKKTKSYSSVFENVPKPLDRVTHMLQEVEMDNKVYIVLLDNSSSNARIMLLPRPFNANYPPREYVCRCNEAVEDDNFTVLLKCSCLPVVKDTKLYMKRISYNENGGIFTYHLNTYICIDLTKLEDVYAVNNKELIDIAIAAQDPLAVTRTHMNGDNYNSDEEERFMVTVSPRTITLTWKHNQLTFIQKDEKIQTIYHLNLEKNEIKSIEVEHKSGNTLSPHPFDVFIAFCPQKKLDNSVNKRIEPFVRRTEILSSHGVETLKNIASLKLMFSETFDSTAINSAKTVLFN